MWNQTAYRLKSLIINLILFIVSIVVFLSAAEFLCRMLIKKPVSHNALFCEYDSLLGWRKIANKKGVYSTSEYSVTECFNSKGLRGPEHSYEKKENEYRILILGDSFAEGYTVEFEELFSEILKDRLNRLDNGKFEVINTGTAGYNSAQEFLFFKNEGAKYLPNSVVLMFYDNDVIDNISDRCERGFRPNFEIDNNGTLALKKLYEKHGAFYSYKSKFQQNIRSSCLYSLIKERIKHTPLLYSVIKKMKLHLTNELPAHFLVYNKEPSDEIINGWLITEYILAGLNAEIKSSGAELVVFYIPCREAIYENYWKRLKYQYNLKGEKWAVKEVLNRLEFICNKHNILLINPIDDFVKEAEHLKAENKMLYFKQDGHWNRCGHQTVGEILARYFQRKLIKDREILYET